MGWILAGDDEDLSQAGELKGKSSRHYGKARVARDRTATGTKQEPKLQWIQGNPTPPMSAMRLHRQSLVRKHTRVR